MEFISIAVLVTCYNRAPVTISNVGRLIDALEDIPEVRLKIILIDDGSPDNTGAEIKSRFPNVIVKYGDGSLFWNRGMRFAHAVAQETGNFDAYLLFNDDVMVEVASVKSFISEYRAINAENDAILVAATLNDAGKTTYSGMRRLSKYRPFGLVKLDPSGVIQKCDTFNGNFVLVPSRFFDKIGGLDPIYLHSYGDVDLGFCAVREGINLYLASVAIGLCDRNEEAPRRQRRLLKIFDPFRVRWLKNDSLRQRTHFIWKNAPVISALPLIGMTIVGQGIELMFRED